jgi:LysM repeat protein
VVDRRDPFRSWTARIVAPVVFFAAVTLLVLLVKSSLEDDGGTAATIAITTTGSATTAAGETARTETAPLPKKFYRVTIGDTLESIAERFDTTVPDLITLNPDIDPLALRPRERIRVR